MKRKLLSVLLVLAMALTLLPTAAFAAGETTPTVSGYGFVWKGGDQQDLVEGATTSGDWMDETMYVYFAETPAKETNLWFQVTVDQHVWGCAASGSEKTGGNTYAFSFLNRGTQWELHPTIDNETFDYSGKNVTHATSYMQAGTVKLEVFTPKSAIKGEQQSAPTAEDLGEAIFTREITIKANEDVKEPVTAPEPPAKTKLGAGTVSGAILNQAVEAVKDITVTATAGTAVGNVIPVKLTASATIPTHVNGDGAEGIWVGFALAAPEGAAKVKYAFSADALTASSTLKESELEANVTKDGKSGIAFYADKSATSPKLYAAVQWIPAENDDTHEASDVTVYKMDLDAINKTDPVAGLTFGAIPNESGNVEIYGKAIANLGAFAFVADEKLENTIKVTGSANYIQGYTAFSSVTEEQEGHYLPIQIKGTEGQKITITGSKIKELTFGSDGSFELIMHLDEIFTKDEPVDPNVRVAADKVGKFTVALEGGPTYTIDCTGITLAAPPTVDDSGKTSVKVEATDDLADLIKDSVETTTDENAPVKVETEGSNKTLTFAPKTEGANDTMTSANKAEVTLPTGLITAVTTGTDTKANVKVETAAGSVTVPTATLNTDAAKSGGVSLVVSDSKIGLKDKTLAIDNGTIDLTVATTIKDATTGVTVTATVGNGGALASVDKKVTVTITGLDKDKNYIVFCITSDNKVTYVGETKPTAKGTIPVETPHLTSFVAVEKTEALAAKVTSMPTEDAKGAAGAKLSTTPVSTTSTYTRSTDALNLVTITGKANTYYIIQATNAKNAAPGLIYCVKAGSDGKAEVRCNASSVLLVLEGTTTPPSLKNGIPDSGLTEVNEA